VCRSSTQSQITCFMYCLVDTGRRWEHSQVSITEGILGYCNSMQESTTRSRLSALGVHIVTVGFALLIENA